MEIFFGGSFDPIHLGHTELVRQLFQVLSPQKIWIVPCFKNPLKGEPHAPAEGRLKMVHAAIQELTEPRIEVLDIELKNTKPSRTLDTVEYLRSAGHPNISLLLGADTFNELWRWHEPALLLEKVELLIIPRHEKIDFDPQPVFEKLNIPLQEAGENQWRYMTHRTLTYYPIKTPPYSSSEIRKQISRGEVPQSIQRSVWQIIKENHYYTVSI